jgi:hypothetical protein
MLDLRAVAAAAAELKAAILDPENMDRRQQVARWLLEDTRPANPPAQLDVKTLLPGLVIQEYGKQLLKVLCPSYKGGWAKRPALEGGNDLPRPTRELLVRAVRMVAEDYWERGDDERQESLDLLADISALQGGSQPAPASHEADQARNIIRLVGEVWQLRYQGEEGNYPVKGNQAAGWLAKLLTSPGRLLTVADLRGDPEGKLAADSLLGSDPKMDKAAFQEIWKEYQDIQARIEEFGSTAEEDARLEAVLARVREAEGYRQMENRLAVEHHNMASQIRAFLKKLKSGPMTRLATHLKGTLQLDRPHFLYNPPAGTPVWDV